MPESWATSGLDLHVDAGRPVRGGLEEALRDAVRSGRLPAGLRLPSSRNLAADLGVARNTVADAYGQLVAEGWLLARQGSGTRVADRVPAVPQPAEAPGGKRRPRYDLRPGSPDVAMFPRTGWLSAARRALSAAPAEAFGYCDPRGRPELRRALAGYLARARGVSTDPERIVVCSGFTQGLGVLSDALYGRGARTLAVEAYAVPEYRRIATAAGLRVGSIPVDDDGQVVDALGEVDGALLTPAHQFPLGAVLGPDRRTRVIDWARRTGGVIVEDDYDGEFRYDRRPVGALQALAPEHVVYAGTASKSLAPGLRLSWLVLPGHLVDDVTIAKALADRGTSSIDQLTLAEFIDSGHYDRQVRRVRLVYRRRRDRLVAAVGRHAPQVRITGIAAGLHALLELPAGQSENDVIDRAARRQLALEGLAAYRTEPADSQRTPALVAGYATPPEHAFTAALTRLTAALTDQRPP